MGPKSRDPRSEALPDTLLVGLLAGWWFFAVSWHFRAFLADEVRYVFFCVFLTLGAVARIITYCYSYQPPINLMGRLVHRRWIIPGYDQIFIAPILALFVAVVGWYVPVWTGVARLYVTPAAVTLAWWTLFGMGPSLQTWRLTGNHRIGPGLANKNLTR